MRGCSAKPCRYWLHDALMAVRVVNSVRKFKGDIREGFAQFALRSSQILVRKSSHCEPRCEPAKNQSVKGVEALLALAATLCCYWRKLAFYSLFNITIYNVFLCSRCLRKRTFFCEQSSGFHRFLCASKRKGDVIDLSSYLDDTC